MRVGPQAVGLMMLLTAMLLLSCTSPDKCKDISASSCRVEARFMLRYKHSISSHTIAGSFIQAKALSGYTKKILSKTITIQVRFDSVDYRVLPAYSYNVSVAFYDGLIREENHTLMPKKTEIKLAVRLGEKVRFSYKDQVMEVVLTRETRSYGY